MPSQFFHQLRLLTVFYKSTLEIAIPVSFVMWPFVWPNILLGFGLGLMSIGTALSLLYRDLTHKNEYYFYYNLGIPRFRLIAFCVGVNFLIGITMICLFK